MGRDSLASTFVESPDPLQEAPPTGEKLIIEWYIPSKMQSDGTSLSLHVIFRNYTEESLSIPVTDTWGYYAYELIDDAFDEKKGILTYKVELVDGQGEVIKEWQQSLWVTLIQ